MKSWLLARLAVAWVALALPLSPAVCETVHFRSAATPPTPLQQRLAKERGQSIAEQPTVELAGELYRPAGDGPFPAVVSLHGCDGRASKKSEDAKSARFVELGYAVLIVDSFGPRGIKERCTGAGPAIDRVMDAYGGLLFLAVLPFIDPERIAVVGYSQGAMVALSAIARDGVETLFDRRFVAAVAYYPLCADRAGAVVVPTLILIGELDDWTPAKDCREMMARRSGEGASLRLLVYPDAYLAFDAIGLRGRPAISAHGHHIEYNEAADSAAWTAAVETLQQAFGR
ncbi:dienelactone hydrolase family protein [soil metagenome]